MERVRLGIAGLGAVAQAVYLPLLSRRAELFGVTAICDLSPNLRTLVGERYAVPDSRRYAEVGELVQSGSVDAVLLLTSGSHGQPAATALQGGHAVLCEKPLAVTVGEADRLAEIAPAGVAPGLQLGYMKQYDPAVRHCADLMAGVTDVRSVEVSVLHPPNETQLGFANLAEGTGADPARVAAIRENERILSDNALGPVPERVHGLYSGVILGSMIHDLSLLRMLAGSPERIDHARSWPEDVFPPSIEVAGDLSGGARFGIRWHYLTGYPAYRETVSIHHDGGTFELCFPAPYLLNAPTELTVVDGEYGRERRAVHRSTTEAFEQQLLAFHAMITSGTAPLSSIAQGREDIITGQRIMRRYCETASMCIGGEAATQ